MHYLQEYVDHTLSVVVGIQLSVKLQVKIQTTSCI